MPCGNCGHTLEGIDAPGQMTYWHCPRCGTFVRVNPDGWSDTYTPKLVERCRRFESLHSISRGDFPEWHSFGIAESIHTPENRSKHP